MGVPVHRREYDAFLSHAHADREFVDRLYQWLTVAGLNIWYDATKMAGGDFIGEGLRSAIRQCRGVVLVGSQEALGRGWVRKEMAVAEVEQGDSPDFRVIPLRMAGADVSGVVEGISWIEVQQPALTADVAARILRAFYPGDDGNPRTSRDVYVSGSWQPSDNKSALAVCRALREAGFRVVGDSKDQKGFKDDRIKRIIESCGAFVGVLPFRDGVTEANATDKPYKYFLTEIDLAAKADIPSLVVADPKVRRTDGNDDGWRRMETGASACPAELLGAIDDLWSQWRLPIRPHYVFFGIDLESPAAALGNDVRELIERVTKMRTIVGNEVQEPVIQAGIAKTIENALLVVADISGSTADSFNLNCCIEAGMAIALGSNLAMLARGQTAPGQSRSPPFMLRAGGQLATYADDVERLGAIHRIVRDYRRRVIVDAR